MVGGISSEAHAEFSKRMDNFSENSLMSKPAQW